MTLFSRPSNPDRWTAPDAPAEPRSPSGTADADAAAAAPVAAGGLARLLSDAEVGALRDRAQAVPFPVRLRPMRIIDVLDSAFAVVKSQRRVVTILILPLVFPTALLQSWFGRQAGYSPIVDFFGAPGRLGEAFGDESWPLLLFLLDILTLSIAGVLMGRLLALWFEGHNPSAARTLRSSRTLVLRAVGASVIVHLIEAVALIGFVVGTLFVMPLLCVVSAVVGIEGAGPVAAVRRSWALGRKHYWQAFWFVVVNAFVVLLLGLLIGWLPSTFAAALGEDGYGWVVAAVAGVLFSSVATAFTALAACIFYLNLRIRSEGMDIAIRARELLPRNA